MNTKQFIYSLILILGSVSTGCTVAKLEGIEGNGAGESGVLRPLGVIEEDYRALSQKQGVYESLRAFGALPVVVDLSGGLPPVGDQGFMNSCVAWAVGYAAKTYQEGKEEGWDIKLESNQFSPAWLYNQINGGKDHGSLISDALDLVTSQGLDTLEEFPYSSGDYTSLPDFSSAKRAARYRAGGWQALPNNVEQIKGILAGGEVVIVSLAVYGDFDRLSRANPVYETLAGEPRGKHAVVIVGYDDQVVDANGRRGAFKIMNSWGTGWGIDGFGWLSYELVGYHAGVVENPAGFYAWKLIDSHNQEPRIVGRFADLSMGGKVNGNWPLVIEASALSGIEKVTYWVLEPGAEETLLAERTEGVVRGQAVVYEYPWATYAQGKNGFYYLRAQINDRSGNILELKSWVFVENAEPKVIIENPSIGQVLKGVVPVRIRIEDPLQRNVLVKRLIVQINGKWEYTVSGQQASYEYLWDTSKNQDGEQIITVIVEWEGGYLNNVWQELAVQVKNLKDLEVPTIKIQSPSTGYFAAFVKGVVEIKGSAEDDTGVAEVTLRLVKTGAAADASGNPLRATLTEKGGWSYLLDTRSLSNYATYEVVAQVRDLSGKTADSAKLKIFVMNY